MERVDSGKVTSELSHEGRLRTLREDVGDEAVGRKNCCAGVKTREQEWVEELPVLALTGG